MGLLRAPILVFVSGFVVMWVAAQAGVGLRGRQPVADEGSRHDLDIIVTATLALLGLIIGFSFSMAVTRYDQRKNYEAEEANAIGTEYVRAGLLPPQDATKVRQLLKSYLDRRISFYTTQDERQLEEINASTARVQADLWSVVQASSAVQPTPVVALAVSGMNDVLNSQGYTQAAWWNHIPVAAWSLMAAISICCNLLLGYDTRYTGRQVKRFFVLPLIVSIAFFLISDMDSPRRGVIRVHPHNLESLALSLRTP
jgi:hypothetical protein